MVDVVLFRYGADMYDINTVCDIDCDDLPGDLYMIYSLYELMVLGRESRGWVRGEVGLR